MKISEHCLEYFNKNKTGFVYRSVTVDETWIHHYTLESKQWTEGGYSALKKARSFPSGGKFVAFGLLIILKRVKQKPGNIIPIF
jgi:hypothetical protein